MSSVPRIVRVAPRGSITRPEQGIPVMARLHWHHGAEEDVVATAVAWTKEAVEIHWEVEAGMGLRSDWIAAGDVRRSPNQDPSPVNAPPRTVAGKPRARW